MIKESKDSNSKTQTHQLFPKLNSNYPSKNILIPQPKIKMEKLFANITMIAIMAYVYVQQRLIEWAGKQIIAYQRADQGIHNIIMQSRLMANYDDDVDMSWLEEDDEEFEAGLAEMAPDLELENQYEINLDESDDNLSEDNLPDTQPNIIQQILDYHFQNIDKE